MLDLLILATSVAPCGSMDKFTDQCSIDGSISDDGAVLNGSIFRDNGDDNTVGVDGGGTDEELPYCARKTAERCDFEFSIIPPPSTGVTLNDVAAFRADPGTVATEPSGWAVIGLTMNAISTATAHTVDGTLLGQPATVRFTPVSWTWEYGDGGTATTSTGGGRWAALGVPEFDPTPTGHIYAARGSYTVSVTVDFLVEYRLGGGAWTRIPGTLPLPATAPTAIRAVGARTVLVAENCRENPRGPGC